MKSFDEWAKTNGCDYCKLSQADPENHFTPPSWCSVCKEMWIKSDLCDYCGGLGAHVPGQPNVYSFTGPTETCKVCKGTGKKNV